MTLMMVGYAMTLMMCMNLGFAWGTPTVSPPRIAPARITWNVTDSGITWNRQANNVSWNTTDQTITKDTY